LDALKAKAETSIRAGAPEVAAKAEGLVDAVDALHRLCGVEITRVEDYHENARKLAD